MFGVSTPLMKKGSWQFKSCGPGRRTDETIDSKRTKKIFEEYIGNNTPKTPLDGRCGQRGPQVIVNVISGFPLSEMRPCEAQNAARTEV